MPEPKFKLSEEELGKLETMGQLKPDTAAKMRGSLLAFQEREGFDAPQTLEERAPGGFERLLETGGAALRGEPAPEYAGEPEAAPVKTAKKARRQKPQKENPVTKTFISLLEEDKMAAGFAQTQPDREFIPAADMPQKVQEIMRTVHPLAAGWYTDELNPKQRVLIMKLKQMGIRERAVREAQYRAQQPEVAAERKQKMRKMYDEQNNPEGDSYGR